RGHHAALDGITNVVPLVVRVTVGDERERRVLARRVTGLAARVQNADDLVVEGRGRLLRRRRRREQEDYRQSHDEKARPHRRPPRPVGCIPDTSTPLTPLRISSTIRGRT